MKFRRKSEKPDPAVAEPGESDDSAGEGASDLVDAEGPFDIDDLPDDGVQRVDLGSLLIAPEEGRELRLQVDESTQAVQAVLLAGPDGALELRAFAAPRNGDLWTEVRPQLAADLARRGGTATEREGRFGTELVCQLSVQTAEGRAANQASRIIGINGPRWMLRGTFLGRPAIDPDSAAAWEDTLTKVVIRRGEHAMPAGDPLPVVLPESARRTPDES
ncbi:MAG: DUF3710 domain-containing protein [Nocardioides sp.]